jgi:hypothetical protein
MMTEVRSYNGHGERLGHFAAPAQSGDNFLAALQDAVRENPIPAALIGMGVAWMFMGGGNVSLFGGSGRKSLFGTAAHGATQAAGAVGQAGAAVGHARQHCHSRHTGDHRTVLAGWNGWCGRIGRCGFRRGGPRRRRCIVSLRGDRWVGVTNRRNDFQCRHECREHAFR